MNLRNSEQNTSTTSKSTKKVRGNGQSTNASTTKSSSSRNNTLQLLVHALLTVTSHHQTLVLELFCNVTGGGARNLNPGLGEEGTGNKHESDVHSSVNRVKESLLEVQGRRHVVGNTRSSVELRRSLTRLPDSEKLDEDVVREAREQHLADQEDVGAQSGLEHNGHVGGVEQANGVRTTHSTLAGRLDGDLNTEALEVDDTGEDKEGSQEVHDVGKVLAVESFVQSTLLVGPGQQQVEQRDNSTLKLRATTGVDGRGGEGLPNDRLANVGRDEKRDTASETVALLEQFIKEDDHKTSNNQLNDQQDTDTSTKVTGLAVETSQDVDTGLAKGKDDSEKLLGGLVQFTVGFEVQVDIDEVGTSEELFGQPSQPSVQNQCAHIHKTWETATYLEHHAGGDDRGNTQFHQRTPITGKHHTQPVQRIRSVGRDDTIQGHLAHDQEDQESQLNSLSVFFQSFPSFNPSRSQKGHKNIPPSTSISG